MLEENGLKNEDLLKEASVLKSKLNSIMEAATFAPSNKMLYDPKNEYNSILGKVGADEGSYVITDDKEVYDELNALCEVRVSDADIRFHDDENIRLSALYDLKKYLGLALSKNVWLKNGGYLVIEHTEALNVIDVNTGKSIEGKKAKEKHVFETNMLAAKEVARQLRLRNMSGIIVVDFIDMNGKDYNDKLMSELKSYLKSDPIHANVVDITALGLVEITRKKVKKPLYEIF
jgi:ribonuclease G